MLRAAARRQAHPASERWRIPRHPSTQPLASGHASIPRPPSLAQSCRHVPNHSAHALRPAAALLLTSAATRRTQLSRPACQSAAPASTGSVAGLASIGGVQRVLKRRLREPTYQSQAPAQRRHWCVPFSETILLVAVKLLSALAGQISSYSSSLWQGCLHVVACACYEHFVEHYAGGAIGTHGMSLPPAPAQGPSESLMSWTTRTRSWATTTRE